VRSGVIRAAPQHRKDFAMEASLSLPRRIRRRVGKVVRPPMRAAANALIAFMHWLISFTRNGTATFLPTEEFAWAKVLEKDSHRIRAELDGVLVNLKEIPNAQHEYAGQSELTTDDKWKTFTLYRGRKLVEENARRCPETTRLLLQIPNLTFAFFSILAGHKHLAAHHGPYAGMLNCHLGLLVPEAPHSCRIRVGSDVREWQEGRLMIFDESHEHEVWNDSDEIRVVLLMYIIRPLPFPLSLWNRLTMMMLSVLMR